MIDHLGRGQIADCPTAVSELWKNSYDAYARNTALHVFDGDPLLAAVFDDGHGMSYDDFMSRWLVIGTESKLSGKLPRASYRNGLSERSMQGEKGIGRLSAAFLGPVTVVISKSGRQYIAALVDWRHFETPYLALSDIRVPVEQFARKGEFASALARMIRLSTRDLHQANRRTSRNGWGEFSRQANVTTTSSALQLADSANELTDRVVNNVLPHWMVWSGVSRHGTAIVTIGAAQELAGLLESDAGEDSVHEVHRLLRTTLTGFVDPYSRQRRKDFQYRVIGHTPVGKSLILSSDTAFGPREFNSLEHQVVGRVDCHGVFHGRVRAFGVDQGPWTIPLRSRSPKKPESVTGPFDICLGTYELSLERSSLTPEAHAQIEAAASHHAGLAIYRDGLRVMPYGRPEADFFGIEERRSKHAGREFWSYRRTFGRVAFTRSDNPNLRDKAGREGLIDNGARRGLKSMVVELLKAAARRFFNADSDVTKELLPDVRKRNCAAREAERRASHYYRHEFLERVRQLATDIGPVEQHIANLAHKLGRVGNATDGLRKLSDLGMEIGRVRSTVDALAPPHRPHTLGRFESEYRNYSIAYGRLRLAADKLANSWESAIASREPDPVQIAAEAARGYSKQLQKHLHSLAQEIQEAWSNCALPRISGDTATDGQRFALESRAVMASIEEGKLPLAQGLRQLDRLRSTLQQEFTDRYGECARGIRQLAQGIGLATATVWGSGERVALQDQIKQLTPLAQLGLAIESVGNDFATIEERIGFDLQKMPKPLRDAWTASGLRSILEDVRAQLRSLEPMRISGANSELVKGTATVTFLEHFFAKDLSDKRIVLNATPAFRKFSIRSRKSPVLQAFLHLVRNSIYWVTRSKREREIRLDVADRAVIVGDSGPGVAPKDESLLFTMFFSRRHDGRGVGLFLCQQNLAAVGHSIEYAAPGPCRILPGANFVIRFHTSRDKILNGQP